MYTFTPKHYTHTYKHQFLCDQLHHRHRQQVPQTVCCLTIYTNKQTKQVKISLCNSSHRANLLKFTLSISVWWCWPIHFWNQEVFTNAMVWFTATQEHGKFVRQLVLTFYKPVCQLMMSSYSKICTTIISVHNKYTNT